MKRRTVALLLCSVWSAHSWAQAPAPTATATVPANPPADPTTPAADQASTPLPGQAAEGGPNDGVADIVVTAQKRSESLQKVPIAITALTSAALQQRGITGLANLASSPVVGLNVRPFAGDSSTLQFETRGVSSIDPGQGTVEAGTGIYIDDVYLGRAQGLGSELVDPERIEVLRGPQGTLFGRNSEGGAVRIVTKKPTGELAGEAKVTVGNYDKRRYEAHLNLPEIAGFSIKLDYLHNDRDPFTANGTGRIARIDRQDGFGGESGEGYRAAVRWTPADGLIVDYAYDHVRTSIEADYWQLGMPLGARPVDDFSKRNKVSWIGTYHEPFVTKSQSHTLTAAYELSDHVTLKSITGYRKTSNSGSNSLMGAFTFLPFSAFGIPSLPVQAFRPGLGTTSLGLPATTNVYAVSGVVADQALKQSQFSEEVQLVGNAGDFQYVLGGYYFHEKVNDQRQTLFNIMYTDPTFTAVVGTNPFYLPFPGQGITAQNAKTRSLAAFTQVTWTPGFADDRLHVTGGLRYTNDRKQFLRYLCGGIACSLVPDPFKASRFDPAFTVAYDVTPRVNVYAKYAQAYRAGGVSVRSPTFAPFGAETNKSIEAGVKSDLFDRRLRLNLAAYREHLRDVQNNVLLNPQDPTSNDTVNVPGYNLYGAELEMTVVPADGLNLSGSYAYQHGPGAFRVTPPGQTMQDAANYYVESFPKHQLSVALDWSLPEQPFGQFLVHLDYSVASKHRGTPRVADVDTNPLVERDVANARLTLQNIAVGPTKLRIAGFVNNVFDTAYPANVAAQQQAIISVPRTYGIEAAIAF